MNIISIKDAPVKNLQHEGEWDTFIQKYYKNIKTPKVLEIGSFYGATLWSFIQNNDIKQIISLDLSITSHDHRYNEMLESKDKWLSWSNKMVRVEGDSHNQQIIQHVHSLIPENDLDLLFIDGDHSYEGVKMDYNEFKSLVKPGGLIVFHDSKHFGVNPFADEIKNTLDWEEVYEEGGWGILITKK